MVLNCPIIIQFYTMVNAVEDSCKLTCNMVARLFCDCIVLSSIYNAAEAVSAVLEIEHWIDARILQFHCQAQIS